MKSFLRRHPFAAVAAALVLVVVAGVALAPWWIDLGPVRSKIQSAASTALAGTLTYERMDLSWFPRTEVVVRSAKVSVPGVRGTVRAVRVSPALLPLLRGKVVLTKIAVDGLDLGVTLNAPKDAERSMAPPGPDWTQTLRSLGSQTLDVELSRSRVVLSRPTGKSLTFEGIRLEASLRSADGKAGLTLSRLSLESPRLHVEGSLHADAAGPRLEATARGTDLDATDVRVKLLSFAGDDPTIAAIFSIVRGGTLTSFSFATSGRAPGELGALERMTIRAAVEDGKVRVPGPDLDLADVRADAALVGGVLSAERAAARIGKSRASGGSLLLGLAKGDDRLQVDAQFRADLAEAPAILSRVIPGRSFREELALVEGLEGAAEGRITIGDLKSAPKTNVSVSEMQFSANYRRLSWPVRVSRGRFFFDGKRVGVSEVSGSIGRSTLSGIAARVRLEKSAVLEAVSGSIGANLEDVFAGLAPREGMEALRTNVRRLSGTANVKVNRLSGPFARPQEWVFDAAGTLKDLVLDTPALPKPLELKSGGVMIDTGSIRATDVEARTMDASLRISGALSGYRHGSWTLEATAEGEVGAEAIRWGWERASLPARFLPAAPIALQDFRVSLAGGALSLAGSFVVANGPGVTLDMSESGGKTEVRDLTIAEGDARGSIALRREEETLDIRFKGRLDVSTVQKLLAGGQFYPGGFEGDFRALVPVKNPGRLTAEGTLTATNFDVPTPAGLITIERLGMRATGNRFDVASSSFVLDEQRFSLAGSATFGDEVIALDMDVATGDLSWTRVEKVLGRFEDAKKKATAEVTAVESKAVEASPKTAAPALPAIGGDVRVSLGSFAYGNLVWKPVLADVRFEKDAAIAAVRMAEICGISTTGEARFSPGGVVALEARADAAGPDINVPLTCLGLENVGMTGGYEASVQVKGEGAASELPRVVRGPLTFKSVKGRIGKATLLTRILGVVNATDVFAGKSGSRVGEAMPYDEIALDGELAEGRVSIRGAALKSPSITMAASGTVGISDQSLDLMVLTHPLSTVDKVVQAVPVVRNVLGRNFLAVAVKVTGSIGDPVARVTPARDVGKGLIGILERTVTLPVTVFDPPSQAHQ